MRATLGLLPCALGLLALLPSPAGAHKKKAARGVMISARAAEAPGGKGQVDVMVWLHLPKSPRTHLLKGQYDLDRDGKISEAESQLLADALGPRILGSYVLLVGGKPVGPATAKPQAADDGAGGINAAILLAYPGVSWGERPLKVEARLKGGVNGEEPARAEMSAMTPLELVDASDHGRPLWIPGVLKPGGPAYGAPVRRAVPPVERRPEP